MGNGDEAEGVAHVPRLGEAPGDKDDGEEKGEVAELRGDFGYGQTDIHNKGGKEQGEQAKARSACIQRTEAYQGQKDHLEPRIQPVQPVAAAEVKGYRVSHG